MISAAYKIVYKCTAHENYISLTRTSKAAMSKCELTAINQIQINMGKTLYTCGIFSDPQKAFDTVNYICTLSGMLICLIS